MVGRRADGTPEFDRSRGLVENVRVYNVRGRVAVAVGLLAVAGVGALLYFRSRDETTPVSVRDAVSDFRGETVRADDRPRYGPAPGVYAYATTGFERVGGTFSARHDYPRTSAVTVTETPCGVRERWDAIGERRNTVETCIGAQRTRVRSIDDYHEFFGQPREVVFSCTGSSAPRPGRMTVGLTWRERCRSDDGDGIEIRAAVRELGEVQIAQETVPAVHVRLTSVLRGSVRGGNVIDSWLRRSDGLLLRRRQRVDTAIDTPVGEAPYRERVEIELRSLEPSH